MKENSPLAVGVVHEQSILINSEVMFSNHKDKPKKSIEKRQKNLLKKITPFINSFLKSDETIQLITTGCSPISIWEQIITGWIVFYLKQSVFVFTDQRILHIPTKSGHKPRNIIAQIRYSDCKAIAMKRGFLDVRFKNDKKERFFSIAGKERKKLKKSIIPQIDFNGESAANPARVHLCPRCAQELEKDNYQCLKCQLEFKNMEDGKKYSIFFPGGGYFYTGHPILGSMDAIGEVALIFLALASLVDIFQQRPGGLVLFVLFGILLILEKAISIYHAHHFIKEYIPLQKNIEKWPMGNT